MQNGASTASAFGVRAAKRRRSIVACAVGIFWDLHDGTDLELWAPNGVPDQFDQVEGGSFASNPASHKLLDVLFGYLGGKKHPENPDYADRGIQDIDHVDVLDGMMCRGHMTQVQAQELLHDVMNYTYDFDQVAAEPCPNG